MKPPLRFTQRSLVLGFYWGQGGSPNPGLNVWWRGRYVWPWERKKAKGIHPETKPATLFDGEEIGNGLRLADQD